MSDAFVELLVSEIDLRLGELLLQAQAAVPLNLGRGAVEVLNTFLLFGDPALLIQSE